ncbi:hypothetical protein HK105_201030 [Polyrhizophydium stewartii]|uniref:Amino acid transporter transmembrane domain-containing protein n=1 Tax=Polyrhizophydium stewartii TaxID=2732419 RepID=A0ABR4NIN0_9FUNG
MPPSSLLRRRMSSLDGMAIQHADSRTRLLADVNAEAGGGAVAAVGGTDASPALNAHGRPIPSVLVLTIDLINTIMGTGLMSLPYAFATVGLGFGSLLICVSAAATWFSVRLLISSCQLAYGRGTGRVPAQSSLFVSEGEPSYAALAKTAMGPHGAVWADIALAASCFGFAVSYLVSIADSMPQAAAFFFPESLVGPWIAVLVQSPKFWMFAFLVIIAPLCYARSVDDFWWFSSTALAAALYLAAVVVFLSFSVEHPHPDPGRHERVPWFSVKLEAFESISIFIFSFTCHPNLFAVYNEVGANYRGQDLPPEKVRHIRRVVDFSMISVGVLYLAVGIIGFLAFGDTSMILILDNFPNTFPIAFGRLMYALLAALSVPIQIHPSRASIDSVLTTLGFKWRSRRFPSYQSIADHDLPPPLSATPSSSLGSRVSMSDSGNSITSSIEDWLHERMHHERGRRFILTSVTLALTYLTAMWFTTLEDVISFAGSSGGVIMCFVMPAMFYWNLTTRETGGWRRPFSLALALAGSFCGVLNVGWILFGAVAGPANGGSGTVNTVASAITSTAAAAAAATASVSAIAPTYSAALAV